MRMLQEEYKDLVAWWKELLGSAVSAVKISNRCGCPRLPAPFFNHGALYLECLLGSSSVTLCCTYAQIDDESFWNVFAAIFTGQCIR